MMSKFKIIIILLISIFPSQVEGNENIFKAVQNPLAIQEKLDSNIQWVLDFPDSMTIEVAEIVDIKSKPVVQIFENQQMNSGKHVFKWNGKSKSGEFAPDGVYYLRVLARDSRGNIWRYPGGIEFTPQGKSLKELNITHERFNYINPDPGLVTIRIGYKANQKQALCQTIVNWEFQDEGSQSVEWKSTAFNGEIDMSKLENLLVNASCYPLKDGSVCLKRNIDAVDKQMESILNEQNLFMLHDANRYRYEMSRGDFTLDVSTDLVKDKDSPLTKLSFNVSVDRSPFGWLETPGLSREIKLFIDDKLMYRSKVGKFPFKADFLFNELKPGKHRVVINTWDNSNRFGYWTGFINMDSAVEGEL